MSSQLLSHNITPDVLPSGTELTHSLSLKWPEAQLDTPSKQLGRQETQPTPTVYVTPVPESSASETYVLIMTDPDLMSQQDEQFGQVRHWLAKDVTIARDGELVIPQDGTVSPYVGPAPLPNVFTGRQHRYTFILAKPQQTGASGISITQEDLNASQHKYQAAFEGRQELQDLKDRWGFDAADFMRRKSLVPVAATFMLVGGNAKSAAENLKLTGQAIAHKV